jgi:hypothetical protein
MKCVICGKEIEESKYMNAVFCSTECFKRFIWPEILDDAALIIDGECYHVEQIRKRKQRKKEMWERHEKFAEYVEKVKKKRRADND